MKQVVFMVIGAAILLGGMMTERYFGEKKQLSVLPATVTTPLVPPAHQVAPPVTPPVVTPASPMTPMSPVQATTPVTGTEDIPPELKMIIDMPISQNWGWEVKEQSLLQSANGSDSEFVIYLNNSSGQELDIYEFRIGCGCKITSPVAPVHLAVGQRVEVRGTVEWHDGASIGMLALSSTGEKSVAVFHCTK